jgi:hypothetical protein
MFDVKVKMYKIIVEDRKEMRMYRLYRFVLSHAYPQKKEAGIAENKAKADIAPMSISEPPMATTYKGRKIDSNPKAIS